MGIKVAKRKLRNAVHDEGVVETAAESKPNSHNALSRYFSELSGFGLLKPKEERDLARRIDEHVAACISVMLSLLKTAALIVKGKAPSPRAMSHFTEHPYVIGRMRSSSLTEDEGLTKTAEHLQRLLNPEGLKGKDLKEHVATLARSEMCASLLEMFVSKEAKRDFDTMVEKNLRLVINLSKRFHGMSQADLIQEGNVALMTAVARFDVTKGFRFSTYAGWWIRHHMSRAISDKGRTIRVPVHALELHTKMRRATDILIGKLGRRPTPEEIAREMDLPLGKIIDRMNDPLSDISLDAPMFEGEAGPGNSPGQTLLCEDQERDTSESLIRKQEADHLVALLKHLKPMERDILERRFGLETDEDETLKEIAETYNLSRERIRQIQEKALSKLRAHFRRIA